MRSDFTVKTVVALQVTNTAQGSTAQQQPLVDSPEHAAPSDVEQSVQTELCDFISAEMLHLGTTRRCDAPSDAIKSHNHSQLLTFIMLCSPPFISRCPRSVHFPADRQEKERFIHGGVSHL